MLWEGRQKSFLPSLYLAASALWGLHSPTRTLPRNEKGCCRLDWHHFLDFYGHRGLASSSVRDRPQASILQCAEQAWITKSPESLGHRHEGHGSSGGVKEACLRWDTAIPCAQHAVTEKPRSERRPEADSTFHRPWDALKESNDWMLKHQVCCYCHTDCGDLFLPVTTSSQCPFLSAQLRAPGRKSVIEPSEQRRCKRVCGLPH